MDVEFTRLQPIVFNTTGNGNSVRYWYTIISLTNNSEEDVDFYPNFKLMTDTFKLKPAGEEVSETVFEHIKSRHQSQYPFLESLNKTSNRVLQGEDNAKDIAVIWSDFDNNTSSIKLFLTGFSNETAVVEQPIFQDSFDSQNQVFLRKTLELCYSVMGDPSTKSNSLEYTGKRWIMR